MPRAVAAPPEHRTLADLLASLEGLGDIPPDRIRLRPIPSTATPRDVLEVKRKEGLTCELIGGTLVEKAMGLEEGWVAVELIFQLSLFLREHNLGIVSGPDGTIRLLTGLLRVPDVSFISWDRLPDRKRSKGPVPRVPIDLAVEIISRGNTRAEMQRKLREYFDAGTRLVWFLYPAKRVARVYTAPGRFARLTEDDTLDGGDVLPGFRLPLKNLLDRANRGAEE